MKKDQQGGQPINLFINTQAQPLSTNAPPLPNLQKPNSEKKKVGQELIPKKTVAFEMYDTITAKKQQALISIIGIVATMFTAAVNIKLSAIIGLMVCALIAFSMRKDIQLLKYYEEKYGIKPKKGLF